MEWFRKKKIYRLTSGQNVREQVVDHLRKFKRLPVLPQGYSYELISWVDGNLNIAIQNSSGERV
jgi:hypothetical protein